MSDWNPVTLKKKSSSVEPSKLPTKSFFSEVSAYNIQTKRLCAEFTLHSGSTKLNPAVALRDLFLAMHQANDSITFYNEKGDYQVLIDNTLQFTGAQFEQHFLVQPHLGRNGGGRIHVHFRVSKAFSLSHISQHRSLLQFLQHCRIWLAIHQFSDKAIATVGFIFLKSPAMTNQEDYTRNIKTHLLRQPSSNPSIQNLEASQSYDNEDSSPPVSYTHLTLPTIA